MPTKYPEEFIIQTVKKYESGTSIKELSKTQNVASSTLYHWVKAYKTIPRKKGEYTPVGYQRLLDHKRKLDRQLEVIHLSGCIDLIPAHQRLFVLEDIHENHPEYSIYELCEALEVPRGTFYNHIKRRVDRSQKEAENEQIKLRIRSIFDKSKQTYGAEKIRAALLKEDIHICSKRVSAFMKEMGLESVRTDAKKQYELRRKRDKENIVKRKFTTDQPNKIWVSDFTYFEVQGKWMYLCVVIELYSRRVISYHISRSASKNLVSKTFLNAYRKRGCPKNLIFHSDRGVQYTAKAFVDLLKKLGIKQSFSAPGNPLDNAVAESFFSTFKKEEAYRRNYTSERSFIDGVANYIEFFNNERQHETLNYHTPAEFERKFGL